MGNYVIGVGNYVIATAPQNWGITRSPTMVDKRRPRPSAGVGILAEIRAARATEANRVFSCLSPADRAELARILSEPGD